VRLSSAVSEDSFNWFSSVELKIILMRPICYMFKLNCSAQDVAARYHNICIIGVFDHPVTRGHRWQVWRVDDEGDWADSGPLYDAGSYALKTWYKSAESSTVRVVTEKNRLASCTLDLGYSAKLSSSVGLPGSNNDTVKTFCRAMLCISADYAVMRCLCVCV